MKIKSVFLTLLTVAIVPLAQATSTAININVSSSTAMTAAPSTGFGNSSDSTPPTANVASHGVLTESIPVVPGSAASSSFSSSAQPAMEEPPSVPDGGSTLLMLGAALSGLGLMARRFMIGRDL